MPIKIVAHAKYLCTVSVASRCLSLHCTEGALWCVQRLEGNCSLGKAEITMSEIQRVTTKMTTKVKEQQMPRGGFQSGLITMKVNIYFNKLMPSEKTKLLKLGNLFTLMQSIVFFLLSFDFTTCMLWSLGFEGNKSCFLTVFNTSVMVGRINLRLCQIVQ